MKPEYLFGRVSQIVCGVCLAIVLYAGGLLVWQSFKASLPHPIVVIVKNLK